MGHFDHLWSGWRGEYVATVPDDEQLDTSRPACVFCAILDSGLGDEETQIVHRGERVMVILNAYPYATGHVLVMPYRHTGALTDLDPAESVELWSEVTRAVSVLTEVYSPEGHNVGLNLGRVSGAGIPGHLHVHVLPRWGGDTNFMTSVANARVLPEALSVTRDKLAAAWPGVDRPS